MGNCLQTRSKVDCSLSSQATSGATKLPNRDHLSASSSLIKADSGEGVPSSRSAARTESDILSSPHLKAFTFTELKNATKNFRSDNLIGHGGFGYVYKGWLDEQTLAAARPGCGMVVAVKKLKPEGFQGHKEWLSEVNYLGQLHHPNLVKLIGYCLEEENRLLVYEYLSKGSLENHLFRRGARPLSWAIRIRVAIDAARGLSFLHDSEEPVIYRDFKASNILLDSEFNAKLSDFGLAKAGPTGDHSHVSTQVLGTQGYAAPEYIATGRLTARCDVYSFGVVLLELLSGRCAVDKTKIAVEENLVDWAKPYLGDRRKLFRIMDTKLEGQYPQRAAYTVALLALQCISEAKVRPQMAEVLSALEQLPTFPSLASPRDVHRSSHSEAQAVASPIPKSPLRKSYPTSPATMQHKGSSLPSEMKSSSHVNSQRERQSFEMKSPLNVKSSQEMQQSETKSPRNAKSSEEMQQSETKSRNVKSSKQMQQSQMTSPRHVKSSKEHQSSETRPPHHVQSPPSGTMSPCHIKSPRL